MKWVYNDGGRADAGRKGDTNDCVVRSAAIITGMPYTELYGILNNAATLERPRNGRRRSSARTGVRKATTRRFLASLELQWTPTMQIGSGCQVHLKASELPPGRLVVSVSKHLTAVIDGVIHDTHDCSRDETRCVYGYWTFSGS